MPPAQDTFSTLTRNCQATRTQPLPPLPPTELSHGILELLKDDSLQRDTTLRSYLATRNISHKKALRKDCQLTYLDAISDRKRLLAEHVREGAYVASQRELTAMLDRIESDTAESVIRCVPQISRAISKLRGLQLYDQVASVNFLRTVIYESPARLRLHHLRQIIRHHAQKKRLQRLQESLRMTMLVRQAPETARSALRNGHFVAVDNVLRSAKSLSEILARVRVCHSLQGDLGVVESELNETTQQVFAEMVEDLLFIPAEEKIQSGAPDVPQDKPVCQNDLGYSQSQSFTYLISRESGLRKGLEIAGSLHRQRSRVFFRGLISAVSDCKDGDGRMETHLQEMSEEAFAELLECSQTWFTWLLRRAAAVVDWIELETISETHQPMPRLSASLLNSLTEVLLLRLASFLKTRWKWLLDSDLDPRVGLGNSLSHLLAFVRILREISSWRKAVVPNDDFLASAPCLVKAAYQNLCQDLLVKWETTFLEQLATSLENETWTLEDELPASTRLLCAHIDALLIWFPKIPYEGKAILDRVTHVLALYRIAAFEVVMTPMGAVSIRSVLKESSGGDVGVDGQPPPPPPVRPGRKLSARHLGAYLKAVLHLKNLADSLADVQTRQNGQALDFRDATVETAMGPAHLNRVLASALSADLHSLHSAFAADIKLIRAKVGSILVKSLDISAWLQPSDQSAVSWELPKWMQNEKEPASIPSALHSFCQKLTGLYRILIRDHTHELVSGICRDALVECALAFSRAVQRAEIITLDLINFVRHCLVLYHYVPSSRAVAAGVGTLPSELDPRFLELHRPWTEFINTLIEAGLAAHAKFPKDGTLSPLLQRAVLEIFPDATQRLTQCIQSPQTTPQTK